MPLNEGQVELFGTRTTATLGEWGEHQVSVAAVVTGVKRQISKKTGKEYARLVLEDFHGTAEAIEDPERPFWLAVQWHPENFYRTGEFRALFEAFVAAAKR